MIIVHRCTACHHPDVWGQSVGGKRPTNCGQDGCPCGQRCQWGEPSTMARFDRGRHEVLEIVEPGWKLPYYAAGTSCDCGGCRTLYAHLTGATQARR